MAKSRPRPRRTRRGTARTSNIIRRVNNLEQGVEFKPSFDQPSWASAPWWPLTLVANATAASTTFSAKVIHALLTKSTNFPGTVAFNLRILTVRVWGLDRQPITLDVYDNSIGGCRKLKQLNDRGSPIHYSCLGWRFGKASYAMLNTDCGKDDMAIFTVAQPAAEPATKVAVYIQTLIQLTGVPDVATAVNLGSLMREMEEQTMSTDFVSVSIS